MAPWAGRIRGGQFSVRRCGTSTRAQPRRRRRRVRVGRTASTARCSTRSWSIDRSDGDDDHDVVPARRRARVAVRRDRPPAHRGRATERVDVPNSGSSRRGPVPGRARLAPVVPQTGPTRVHPDRDVPSATSSASRPATSSSPTVDHGTTASSTPNRSCSTTTRRVASDGDRDLRLRSLGGLRRAVRRHLRRTAVRPTRLVQPGTARGRRRHATATHDDHLVAVNPCPAPLLFPCPGLRRPGPASADVTGRVTDW